jgi:hypothetical protein
VSTRAPELNPFVALRGCAGYVEENGHHRLAGRLLKEIDRAEVLFSAERNAATSLLTAAEAMDKMAVFVFGKNPQRWPAQWREELIALRAAIAKARGGE